MLPLIETIIGFAAIMMTLGFLVKSLTSLIKNHFDFYSSHLKHEVGRLLNGTLNKTLADVKKTSWGKDINWNRLGDEYLTKRNMDWVLSKLGAKKKDLENLEGRLAVHLGNIKYAFEKRLKNISLIVGLALCLGLNINAVSIWNTLYNDQQVRATFAGPYAEAAVASAQQFAKSDKEESDIPEEKTTPVNEKVADKSKKEQKVNKERKKLQNQTENFLAQLKRFQADVNFGVGRIWTDPPVKWWPGFVFEFLGTLLTGILVSIGAPYWHDLLRALTALRRQKKSSEATG